jgi:hypothetical protein
MMYERPWKVTTKADPSPRWKHMFVHSDTEVHHSKHDACGSPVRSQYLRSVPSVVTDESGIVTAESSGNVYYCPKCNVDVESEITIFTNQKPR